MDPEKLNDDQKRTLKTLPTLEAIQKELGEVKKAVEVTTFLTTVFHKPDHTIPLQVHESELAQELLLKRLEIEKIEKTKIAEAVSTAEVCLSLTTLT